MTLQDYMISNMNSDRVRWHPTRNEGMTPADVQAGSRKSAWWQCNRGHEWNAPIYSIKAGTTCPYCAGKYPIPGQTDLASTHPHLVPLWSERNKLSPTEVTAGSHKKVLWVCGKGHEWEAMVSLLAIENSRCP